MMKISTFLTPALALTLSIGGCILSSCADISSPSAATPLPANETFSQYMNPRGYAYPIVDRICDHSL